MKSNQESVAISQQLSISEDVNHSHNQYLLNRNMLHPLSEGYRYSSPLVEKKFRSVTEVEQLLHHNSQTLFGHGTIMIQLPKKTLNLSDRHRLPDNFLLTTEGSPKFYFLDTVTPNQTFLKDVFPRITLFFLFLLEAKNIEELAGFICKEAKKELEARLKVADIFKYVKDAIATNASILLLSERKLTDFSGIKQLYPQPWRVVHSLMLQRYTSNGDTFCLLFPAFETLHQKETEKKEKVQVTEAQHLDGISDEVKAAYFTIKDELLKGDSLLQFNSQTYYIALKKNKNVAFFHIRKKAIDLVVKHPEKDVRKLCKHAVVWALKGSVQKFWGGPSCSIEIKDSTHLQEVIGLLKKMIRTT